MFFKKNPLSVAAKVLRVLREGRKRMFDMGKVSRSFQDYFLTGAGDIEQKAVSTVRIETQSRPTNTIYPRILRKRGYNNDLRD